MYRIGYKTFEYSLGAALSFLQSTIGMLLVLIADRISIKTVNVGIW
jgi:ABC-type polysaccharide transport system permease subunit